MCRFEQNISNDVKKTTKFYVKSKLLSIYIYIEKFIYRKYKSDKSHVSTYHILNVRKPCKITNAKVQIECLHFCSIYLSNIESPTCPPV